MAKKLDKHKKAEAIFTAAVQRLDWASNGSQSLSNEQVHLRKAKCEAKNLCFVSLRPFTPEDVPAVFEHPVAGRVNVLGRFVKIAV